MKKTNPTYRSETTLAFIDILGFKEKLKTKALSEIIKLLNDIKQADNSNKYLKMVGVETKLFSDSLIVFAQLTEQRHVTAFYVYLSIVIARVHKLGDVVTRGYVSCGDHYSDNDFWISKAFVEAHTCEAKYSVHPRVIIGQSAINNVSKIYPEFLKPGHLKRDSDGYWFINYLMCIDEAYTPNEHNIIANLGGNNITLSLKEHKATILEGLKNQKAVISKYLWLANYHNSHVIDHINIPNKEELLIDIDEY